MSLDSLISRSIQSITHDRSEPAIGRTLGRGACIGAVAALSTAAAVHGQFTLHVDDDAPDGGDGLTWATAMNDLQLALITQPPSPESGVVIKIAAGVYVPDCQHPLVWPICTENSFRLMDRRSLEGGYAGRNSPDPDHRDYAGHPTTLSADLERNDDGTWSTIRDNASHVVIVTSAAMASLDGLTIRGGLSLGRGYSVGAGAHVSDQAIVYVRDCVFKDNMVSTNGGAIGGKGSAVIERTLLANNSAWNDGGAVYLSEATIERSRLLDNHAGGRGGAVAIDMTQVDPYEHRSLQIYNSVLAGNHAEADASAMHCVQGFVTLEQCTIAHNSTAGFSTILIDESWTKMRGVIIQGNPNGMTRPISVLSQNRFQDVAIEHSLVEGGTDAILVRAEVLRLDRNIDSDPRFASPNGTDLDPLTAFDNDYQLRAASPCVDAIPTLSGTTISLDIDGRPWPISSRCDCIRAADMGAFERPAPACSEPTLVMHVSPDGQPENDGLSWATALPSLDDALQREHVREVWMRAGTYLPPAPERSGTGFLVPCSMVIRGGFAGHELDPDDRPTGSSAPITIITGDVLGNDDGTAASRADNHPRLLRSTGPRLTLDRLTFRDAFAAPDVYVAPVEISLDQLQMSDCTFERNTGRAVGALYLWMESGRFERCSFIGNICGGFGQSFDAQSNGAAIRLERGDLHLVGCDIQSNRVERSLGGGAVSIDWFGRLSSEFCTFADNHVTGHPAYSESTGGAAIWAMNAMVVDGTHELFNCRFSGNSVSAASGRSYSTDGGAIFSRHHRWNIVGCEFSGNRVNGTSAVGGAIAAHAGLMNISNCTFAGNIADGPGATGGGIHTTASTALTLHGSVLRGNRDATGITASSQLSTSVAPPPGAITDCIIEAWSGTPVGANIRAIDPLFIDADGVDNIAGTLDDDLRLRANSPAIDAALNVLLPSDALDLDRDDNFVEALPFDLSREPRLIDAPAVAGPLDRLLDLGAYEFQNPCRVDFNASGAADIGDLFIFLTDFLQVRGVSDFNRSGDTTVQDLFDFLTAFLSGC